MRSIVGVVALAAMVAGCQVRVVTDVQVATDGGGVATLRIVADDELRDLLEDAGVDLRAGLADAAAGASWSASPVDRPDATGVVLRTEFDTPEQLGQRVEALSAGLTDDDGALLRDVELSRTDDGGYAFTAAAGLDPPRILGALPLSTEPTGLVQDPAVGPAAFDGEALGELLAASDGRLATAELRLTTPTVPDAPGAEVDGSTATWELPVDGLATVTAMAPPVPVSTSTVLLVAAVVAAVVVGLFGIRLARRRG